MRVYGAWHGRDGIRRLRDKKWRGVYSINYVYSTGAYQRELYDFHVSALAEYSWNLEGRSARDFARAWATRASHAQPDKFAEWVDQIGPVEAQTWWTLGSALWAKAPEWIMARQTAKLGTGLLATFPNPSSLDAALSACQQAKATAQAIGRQDLELETQYVAACVSALKSVHELQEQASTPAPFSAEPRRKLEASRAALRGAVSEMIRAFDQRADLLKSEPKSFAESIKKIHTDLWNGRLAGIEAAVARLQ
jgi:hypothetical protein